MIQIFAFFVVAIFILYFDITKNTISRGPVQFVYIQQLYKFAKNKSHKCKFRFQFYPWQSHKICEVCHLLLLFLIDSKESVVVF